MPITPISQKNKKGKLFYPAAGAAWPKSNAIKEGCCAVGNCVYGGITILAHQCFPCYNRCIACNFVYPSSLKVFNSCLAALHKNIFEKEKKKKKKAFLIRRRSKGRKEEWNKRRLSVRWATVFMPAIPCGLSLRGGCASRRTLQLFFYLFFENE